MRNKSTQAMFAYWNEVRRGRRAPGRLEIAPQRIGETLLDAFILERINDLEFRFRLAGTRVSSRFGMDLRDVNFLDLWRGSDRTMLECYLEKAVEEARVGLFTLETSLASAKQQGQETRLTFELLVLPLVHSGGAIDRLLCAIVPLDEDLERSSERLSGFSLVAAEEFQPDAPHLPGYVVDRQSPLSPHIRNSRLVRLGRRQFRVYEGGLGSSGE